MQNQKSGALQVILAGSLWATHGTISSFFPSAVPTLALGAIRLSVGALGLAIILLFINKGRILKKGTYFPPIRLLGASVGLAVVQTSLYYGFRVSSVTMVTMIFIATPPLFSGLYSQFIKKEKQSLSWLVSSILIVIGCILMAFSGDRVLDENKILVGALLGLMAGFCWTFVGTILRNFEKYSDPISSSFVVTLLSSIILIPIASNQGYSWLFDKTVLALSLILGIISSTLPFYLFTNGARKIITSHAFLYGLSEPITASLLGMIVLKERLRALGVIGYIFVITALFLFALWEFIKAKQVITVP